MSAHNFNLPGGEILTGMGATWFVSYAYCEKIDHSHQNWRYVSTVGSRTAQYNKSRQYHKVWLQHIITMNPKNLNKNTIGLNASQTISMAEELLALLEQHANQRTIATPFDVQKNGDCIESTNSIQQDALTHETSWIISLLLERARYPLSPLDDAWFDQIVNSNEDVVQIITTEKIISRQSTHYNTHMFFRTYKLHALYDLKNPYSDTNHNFFLYLFSKKPTEIIHYGIYHTQLRNRFSREPQFVLEENFPKPYSTYLELIEKQITFGFLPPDTDSYEFGSFPAALFSTNHWNSQYYCKQAREARNNIEAAPSVSLGDIVHIILPRPTHSDLRVPVAFPEEWEYPVNYNSLRTSRQTNCVLQKGDIVLFRYNRILIVYEQPPIEIYASSHCFVLRPNCENFCSEYLFYYLTDETVSAILRSLESGDLPRIRPSDLRHLQIAHQINTHEFYQNKFLEENFPYSYLKKHRNDVATNEHPCKPYCGDKEYIFISYAHKDMQEALPIIQYLLKNGYRVWYDEGIDPGTEWDKNIAEHIVNCGYFIAFITTNYLESNNCRDELSFARDLDKNRFLVYLEEVDLPPEMKMRLSRIQNVHKYAYPNDESFFQKLECAKDLSKYKD